MEIPPGSFQRASSGNRAHLKVKDLPMPDTFFYSNNVSVAGSIDVDVMWKATGPHVRRGNGLDPQHPDGWDRFIGHFAEAECVGVGGGGETGFTFETGELTSAGFYASLGPERNGVYL